MHLYVLEKPIMFLVFIKLIKEIRNLEVGHILIKIISSTFKARAYPLEHGPCYMVKTL